MKSVKLNIHDWHNIRVAIAERHPRSVLLVRSAMKRVLGFTVREHQDWISEPKTKGDDINFGYYENCIYLDFYDEKMKTMFLLKYGDMIDADSTMAK